MEEPRKLPEQPQSPINPDIAEMTSTPAGRLALNAISGMSSMESPYFEPSMRRVLDDISRPLSVSLAIQLEEHTKNLAPEERTKFFSEFVAVLNTLWRYNAHQDKFADKRK